MFLLLVRSSAFRIIISQNSTVPWRHQRRQSFWNHNAHQIKKFLEIPKMLATIMHNQEMLMRGQSYKNMVNGSIRKSIMSSYNGKKVIPISIYNDDFNPDNTVSPHASDCKLSAFYYLLPTLPDHLSHNLKFIFLAADCLRFTPASLLWKCRVLK